MRWIHRWPVNSLHKGPVTRKMFPFDDVIMNFKLVIWSNWTEVAVSSIQNMISVWCKLDGVIHYSGMLNKLVCKFDRRENMFSLSFRYILVLTINIDYHPIISVYFNFIFTYRITKLTEVLSSLISNRRNPYPLYTREQCVMSCYNMFLYNISNKIAHGSWQLHSLLTDRPV